MLLFIPQRLDLAHQRCEVCVSRVQEDADDRRARAWLHPRETSGRDVLEQLFRVVAREQLEQHDLVE